MIALALALALTPAQLLAKSRAAAGVLRSGTYHIVERETTADGAIGFDLFERGAVYQETERDGRFTTASGYVDGTSWFQDANGTVLLRTRAALTRDPYLVALRAPEPPAGMRLSTAADGEIVLTVAPRAGLVQRRYYDPRTDLLRRVEVADPRGTAVYDYLDYRRFFGQLRPARVAYRSEFPQDDWTSEIVSFERAARGAVHFAIPANRPVFDLGTRAKLAIPAAFTASGIVVRVTVDGRRLDFLLDSGTASCVIDRGIARQLGLAVTRERTYRMMGTYTSGYAMADSLALGELQATNVAMEVIPFRIRDGNRAVVGLLGGDFFASAGIAVDFAKRRLTMIAPPATAPGPSWEKLPVDVASGVPLARAAFDGQKGTFVVDLGASQTLLFPHYFSKLSAIPASAPPEATLQGVSGVRHPFQRYVLGRLTLANGTYDDVGVDVIAGARNDQAGIDGLLGLNVWRNFRMLFDYGAQAVYVKAEP